MLMAFVSKMFETKLELFVKISLIVCFCYEVYLNSVFLNNKSKGAVSDNLKRDNKEQNMSISVKQFYDLIVLIPSSKLEERAMLRFTWVNETFWRERELNVKILFVVGANSSYNEHEEDLLIVPFEETRLNLIYKVVAGLKIIQKRYGKQFDYVLKTDTDVLNNLGLWVKRVNDLNHQRTIKYTAHTLVNKTKSTGIIENIGSTAKWQELYLQGVVLYGGIYCQARSAGFAWCSGMGYMLHREVLGLITSHASEDYEGAEDRTIGKIMKENAIASNVDIMSKGRLGYKQVLKYSCGNATQDWRDTGCMHFGFNSKENYGEQLYHCWRTIDFD